MTINDILQLFNRIVACLIFSGFFLAKLDGNPYVDWLTLIMGLALCVQTHIALLLERRNPDPFVLLTAYVSTFFYALRIYTLLLYPVSHVFERLDYGPADSNFALAYILSVNTLLYAGLYRVNAKRIVEIRTDECFPQKPNAGIALFVASLLYSQYVSMYIPDHIAQITNLIYSSLFSISSVLMVLAAYIILFRKRLPSTYIKILLICTLIALIVQTLNFSRSALLTYIEAILIIVLVLLPTIRLSRRYVFLLFAILPFLFAVMIAVYGNVTAIRMNKGEMGGSLGDQIELIRNTINIQGDGLNDGLIGNGFARAGFFDFSAEIIANNEKYAVLFTINNYLKSIVDNVLTPGFDVYDQALIANSLKNVDSGNYSRAEEVGSNYHTDQFGLYGEMYALFGFWALPIVYILAFIIKSAFGYNWANNPHINAMNRIIILTLYMRWINSFGLDWNLQSTIFAFVSYHLISNCFYSNKRDAKHCLPPTIC